MKSIYEVILPRPVTNEYLGGKVALTGFCLLLAAQIFSSTVHFLKADSGVNSIASIIVFPGTPDPNHVIYMFSAVGGLNQMMFTLLYALVLWRYRALIPLMLAFMLLEVCFGFVVSWLHPLTPEYYEYVPPAMVVRVPKLLLIATLLVLAVRRSMRAEISPRSGTS